MNIRLRLTLWYAAILAVTFTAAGMGTWYAIRGSIHATVDRELATRMEGLREFVGRGVASIEHFRDELDEDATVARSRAVYQISSTRDGSLIYRSQGAPQWTPLAQPSTASAWAGALPLRVMQSQIPMNADVWRIEIALPLDGYYEMLNELRLFALLASPLALLLASLGGYWMSGRALQPVDEINRTAQSIGAHSLQERLPVRGSGDELDRLSATLNAMFARLQAAFERITQFTADASHELRTPVAVIRTTSELALSRPRTEAEYQRALASILAQSERTSQLIEDLLMLARSDSSHGELQLLPIDLAETLRASCDEARPLAEAAGLAFHTTIPEELAALGDYQALRRLFLILIDNAIKYTPAGNVKVSLATDGKHARIAVTDTGIGIAKEDIPLIFERFYRASKDRSRQTGGAGLGLSIANTIVAAHKGEIDVESEFGTGSTLRVRLPLEP